MSDASRVIHLKGAALAFGVMLLLPGGAATAAPADAIHYLEFPEAGPLADKGRLLKSAGSAYYGIDINSRLDIKVKNTELLTELAGTAENAKVSDEVAELSKQLKLLTQLAASLGEARSDVRKLFVLFANGSEDFNEELKRSSQNRGPLLGTLFEARRNRFRQLGLSDEEAKGMANSGMAQVLSGPQLNFGYNWDVWGALYAEEIRHVEKKLDELGTQLGFYVEIRAHLVGRNGQNVAVYLRNYNEAATGPENRYEKLKFAPSAGEEALYEDYKKMATELGEQRNAGQALIASLELQFEMLREPLAEVTGEAVEALANAKEQLRSLKQWGSAEKRKDWLDSVKTDLEGTSQGKEVRDSWTALEKSLGEIRDDIAALETYANLDKLLAGQDAPQAMNSILRALETISTRGSNKAGIRVLDSKLWGERLDKVDRLVSAVDALKPEISQKLKQPGSPYADFIGTRDALRNFASAIEESASKVKSWLSELLLGSAVYQTAAELPEPAGQRRVAVVANAQLDTSVNLLTIPAARSVNDTLRIEYRFFQQEADMQAGWIDRFSLQSYGWQSEVLASLAFAKHDDEDTWKPTAAMNWILSHNEWPESDDPGRSSSHRLNWFSGFGLSGLSLDNSDTQDVELGLAVTAAFLNNRLLLGYGVNLQAEDDEEFLFLSVRLFTFPGLSGKSGLTGQ